MVGSANGSIAFRPGDVLAVDTSGEGLVAVDLPPALLAELTGALRHYSAQGSNPVWSTASSDLRS